MAIDNVKVAEYTAMYLTKSAAKDTAANAVEKTKKSVLPTLTAGAGGSAVGGIAGRQATLPVLEKALDAYAGPLGEEEKLRLGLAKDDLRLHDYNKRIAILEKLGLSKKPGIFGRMLRGAANGVADLMTTSEAVQTRNTLRGVRHAGTAAGAIGGGALAAWIARKLQGN
jgi:hypothetical protein